MNLERGMVQVYTGNGKGKTTAALGLSLRAVGHDLQVCVVQFMKGVGSYGEHAMELVLTGRNAHPRVLDRADLVTEMREVKHYYRQGVPVRAGIEC